MLRLALAVALAVSCMGAWAHAHLEKALPAADSKSAVVNTIRLQFSEPVEPRLSTIRIETAEERTVTEPGAEVDPADGRVMIVRLFEKLPPGIYRVRWATVGKDGHRVTGMYSFLVSN